MTSTIDGINSVNLDDNVKLKLGTGRDVEIFYDGSNLIVDPDVVAGSAVLINDTSNDNMTIGLTINQGANDDIVFALKSSDVNTLFDNVEEVDTYCSIGKVVAASGGMRLRGFSSAGEGVRIEGHGTSVDDTDTTASTGVISLNAYEHNGSTGRQAVVAGNLFSVRNALTTRLVLKEDGQLHLGNTTLVALADDLPDAVAARQIRHAASGVHSYPRKYAEELERRGIVNLNRDTDGVPFWNLLGMQFFSWDMGFQNFSFLAEIANVLTDNQKSQLSPSFKSAIGALPEAQPIVSY